MNSEHRFTLNYSSIPVADIVLVTEPCGNPCSTIVPEMCCFLRRWNPVLMFASSFTCAGSLHFMRQKNERRAPGQSLDTPCGRSVFTGNIAAKEVVTRSQKKQ